MNRFPDKCLSILTKPNGEKYCFVYDDTNQDRANALLVVESWAFNDELSYSWYDAGMFLYQIAKGVN